MSADWKEIVAEWHGDTNFIGKNPRGGMGRFRNFRRLAHPDQTPDSQHERESQPCHNSLSFTVFTDAISGRRRLRSETPE